MPFKRAAERLRRALPGRAAVVLAVGLLHRDLRRRPSTCTRSTARSCPPATPRCTCTRSTARPRRVAARRDRVRLPRRRLDRGDRRGGPGPGQRGADHRWAQDYWEELHPTSAGGSYVNFLMDEGPDRVRASYRGNYDRLARSSGATTRQPVPRQPEHPTRLRRFPSNRHSRSVEPALAQRRTGARAVSNRHSRSVEPALAQRRTGTRAVSNRHSRSGEQAPVAEAQDIPALEDPQTPDPGRISCPSERRRREYDGRAAPSGPWAGPVVRHRCPQPQEQQQRGMRPVAAKVGSGPGQGAAITGHATCCGGPPRWAARALWRNKSSGGPVAGAVEGGDRLGVDVLGAGRLVPCGVPVVLGLGQLVVNRLQGVLQLGGPPPYLLQLRL